MGALACADVKGLSSLAATGALMEVQPGDGPRLSCAASAEQDWPPLTMLMAGAGVMSRLKGAT